MKKVIKSAKAKGISKYLKNILINMVPKVFAIGLLKIKSAPTPK